MHLHEGKLDASGLRIGIILSKFNSFIGEKLLAGAQDAFSQLGGNEKDLHVFKVPGAYEIPGVARRLIQSGKYDALVTLGVVIQGQTPHFEYVAGNSAKAIMELSLEGSIPVIYGMVTTQNIEQAVDRAGAKMGNKGYDAVLAAVEMVSLYKTIPSK